MKRREEPSDPRFLGAHTHPGPLAGDLGLDSGGSAGPGGGPCPAAPAAGPAPSCSAGPRTTAAPGWDSGPPPPRPPTSGLPARWAGRAQLDARFGFRQVRTFNTEKQTLDEEVKPVKNVQPPLAGLLLYATSGDPRATNARTRVPRAAT